MTEGWEPLGLAPAVTGARLQGPYGGPPALFALGVISSVLRVLALRTESTLRCATRNWDLSLALERHVESFEDERKIAALSEMPAFFDSHIQPVDGAGARGHLPAEQRVVVVLGEAGIQGRAKAGVPAYAQIASQGEVEHVGIGFNGDGRGTMTTIKGAFDAYRGDAKAFALDILKFASREPALTWASCKNWVWQPPRRRRRPFSVASRLSSAD